MVNITFNKKTVDKTYEEIALEVIAKVKDAKHPLTKKDLKDIYKNKLFQENQTIDQTSLSPQENIYKFYCKLRDNLTLTELEVVMKMSSDLGKNNIFDYYQVKDDYDSISANIDNFRKLEKELLSKEGFTLEEYQKFRDNDVLKNSFFVNYLLDKVLPKLNKDQLFNLTAIAIECEKQLKGGANFFRESNFERKVLVRFVELKGCLKDLKITLSPNDLELNVNLPVDFIKLFVDQIEPHLSNITKFYSDEKKAQYTDQLTEKQEAIGHFVLFNIIFCLIQEKANKALGSLKAIPYTKYILKLTDVTLTEEKNTDSTRQKNVTQEDINKVVTLKQSITSQLTREYLQELEQNNNNAEKIEQNSNQNNQQENTVKRKLTRTVSSNNLPQSLTIMVLITNINNSIEDIKSAKKDKLSSVEVSGIKQNIDVQLVSVKQLIGKKDLNERTKTAIKKTIEYVRSIKDYFPNAEKDTNATEKGTKDDLATHNSLFNFGNKFKNIVGKSKNVVENTVEEKKYTNPLWDGNKEKKVEKVVPVMKEKPVNYALSRELPNLNKPKRGSHTLRPGAKLDQEVTWADINYELCEIEKSLDAPKGKDLGYNAGEVNNDNNWGPQVTQLLTKSRSTGSNVSIVDFFN